MCDGDGTRRPLNEANRLHEDHKPYSLKFTGLGVMRRLGDVHAVDASTS